MPEKIKSPDVMKDIKQLQKDLERKHFNSEEAKKAGTPEKTESKAIEPVVPAKPDWLTETIEGHVKELSKLGLLPKIEEMMALGTGPDIIAREIAKKLEEIEPRCVVGPGKLFENRSDLESAVRAARMRLGIPHSEHDNKEFLEWQKAKRAELKAALKKPRGPSGGKNIGSRGSHKEKPPVTKKEKKDREEFEKAKAEFDENEKKIAESRYKAKSRWKVIKETLGFSKQMVEDDTVREYVGRRKDLYQKLMESGRKTMRGNEQEYEEFMVRYDQETVAINSRTLETDIRAKNAKWPEKALIGFANVSKNYREFISKQFLNEKGKLSAKGIFKGTAIAASVSITLAVALGAALPAVGIAAIGAGTTSAWIMRTIGGVGAGMLAKKRMEAGFLESKKKEIEERVKQKIEELKNETNEGWKKMVKGIQSEVTIEGKEQEFADVDARHKKMALLIGGGTIVASALASHFVAPHARGLFGKAWEEVTHFFGGGKTGFYDPAHSPITDAEMLKGPGHVPAAEAIPLGPHGHVINQGDSIWRVTRDIYMENPDVYDLRADDPNVERLFQSFRRQGILGRMGINAESFDDLSHDERIKILAEKRTAVSMRALAAESPGGRVRDLVHAGDTVVVKPDGTIVFNEAPGGIRAGHLDDVRTRGGARGIDTSQFDQQIEAARARGAAAQRILDENARIRSGVLYPEYQAASAAEQAAMNYTRTHELMNFVQSKIYGQGTSVDWRESAREFRKRLLGSFITSDQPMGPPANVFERQQYWRAAQEMTRKLGNPIGSESVEDWVRRGLARKAISPEEIIGTLRRVVNE